MSNNEQIKITHSAGCDWIGKDEIKRRIEMRKDANGGFYFQFRTWWDGEDKEPLTTNLGLGSEAFDVFTNGILAFRMRLNDFELKDGDTPEDK